MDDATVKALLDSMTSMDEDTIYYRHMFYGEGGAGKTKISTDFGTKILYIESDPLGWVALLNHPDNMKKCTRMVYKGLSQLDALSEKWEAGDERFTVHDLIVVDTASAIATLDLDRVLAANAKKNPDKNADVASQPDYGANTERCRRTFTRLLSLPVNIILTAHVREDKNEATGVVTYRPNFTPKLRKDLERMMTLVGYMTAVEKTNDEGEVNYTRFIQVHPTRNVAAKCRIGGLPPVLTNPDMAAITKAWMESDAVEEEVEEVLDESFGLHSEPVVSNDDDDDALSALEI